MRQQRGPDEISGRVRQIVFASLVVARFVVFQTEMADLVAQRQQKVIVAIVCGSE
jgi:hypothetical protein